MEEPRSAVLQELEVALKTQLSDFAKEARRIFISHSEYLQLAQVTREQSRGYSGSDEDVRFQLKLLGNCLQKRFPKEYPKYVEEDLGRAVIMGNYGAHAFPTAEKYFEFRTNFDATLRFLEYLLTIFGKNVREDFNAKTRIEQLREIVSRIPPVTPSSLVANDNNVNIFTLLIFARNK